MSDPKAKPAPYKMPPIHVGQNVVWRHAPGTQPHAAIVTATSREAINVLVFPIEARGGSPRDGCRHVADPRLLTMVEHEGGAWDFTETDRRLLALECALDELDSKVADIDTTQDEHTNQIDELGKRAAAIESQVVALESSVDELTS